MLDKPLKAGTVKGNTDDKTAIVVRFAGDSGDGVQLLGTQFAQSSVLQDLNLMTFPDFPAEIRAPAGTTFGVSAYQIQFGKEDILTPGDQADVLFAFNPAALKTNLQAVKSGGLVIIDEGAFTERATQKAGYESDPLKALSSAYQLLKIDMSKRTLEAVSPLGVGRKVGLRAKNFWALGLAFWIYDRDRAPVKSWLEKKFAHAPEIANLNIAALDAGHSFGETMELAPTAISENSANLNNAEKTRIVTGTDAMALGLAAIAALSNTDLIYCSYPITPASALLHALTSMGGNIKTFQAEDEIAAVSAAIGASYAGSLGITGSSGPGLALKTEALGLAVATELPLIMIDVQRAGPSTGMPTKAEQGDLLMALFGRHGEAPCPVLAPATPGEGFQTMIDAAKMAFKAMTPVIVLSDAYLANAAEHWGTPNVYDLPDLTPNLQIEPEGFHPFQRDEKMLARPWVKPGTPGLEHRIGGLEKAETSGHISYDPENHERMVTLRAEKIARIAERMPKVSVETGAQEGDLVILGWGSTYGAIKTAVRELHDQGYSVGHVHLRQLWPLPRGLEDVLRRFRKVVVAELNTGQLRRLIRSEYLIPAEGLNQVTGQPFKVGHVEKNLKEHLLN